jgi:hypothetical protein
MRFAPVFALALVAPALSAPANWREEKDMAGVQYVGRVPQDGSGLFVKGWRSDGGTYYSDEVFTLAVFSTADRIAISAERFRYREPDGVAAWTISKFMSYPGKRDAVGINFDCGLGKDFEGRRSNTEFVLAVVEWAKAPVGEGLYQDGITGAAKADMKTGTIEPIPTDDVYCIQMLGD